LHCFYKEFDATTTKAFKNCEGDKEKEDALLKEWADSGTYASHMGSRVHYLLEKHFVDLYGAYKEVRQPIFDCDEEQTKNGDGMIAAGKKFIDLMHERGAVLLDTEIVLGSPELGIVGQPDKMLLMRNKSGEIGLVVTDWKGLPLDTPILTNNGWKTMDTLTKEDKVFDKDGNLVNIKNISTVKNKKCLKITFDNKEEIISDFEHRWLVFTDIKGVKKEQVLTTQQIKDYNDNLKIRKSHKILKIENCKPLNNKKIDLPIDPYVLGICLGDGHSADNKITQANIKVWNEIKKRGYEIGKDLSGGGSGKATTRTIFGIHDKLSKLNLLKNKHVPDIYLLSSYEQRLDLLRGLMDSDGYFNKTRNRFSVSTTRKNQVEFCVKIFSSLGLKPTVIKYNKKFKNKIIKCYNVEFRAVDFNPFLSRNQNLDLKVTKNKHSYKTIISVEEVESVPTKCIEVDSPTSTFLCGESLIVTHNTNKKKNLITQPWTKKMLEPFTFLEDTALSHYKLQLNFYAKILLNMLKGSKYEDLPLLGCIIVHLEADGSFNEYRVPKNITDIIMDMDMSQYLPKLKAH
jgi:hypothetical protein